MVDSVPDQGPQGQTILITRLTSVEIIIRKIKLETLNKPCSPSHCWGRNIVLVELIPLKGVTLDPKGLGRLMPRPFLSRNHLEELKKRTCQDLALMNINRHFLKGLRQWFKLKASGIVYFWQKLPKTLVQGQQSIRLEDQEAELINQLPSSLKIKELLNQISLYQMQVPVLMIPVL